MCRSTRRIGGAISRVRRADARSPCRSARRSDTRRRRRRSHPARPPGRRRPRRPPSIGRHRRGRRRSRRRHRRGALGSAPFRDPAPVERHARSASTNGRSVIASSRPTISVARAMASATASSSTSASDVASSRSSSAAAERTASIARPSSSAARRYSAITRSLSTAAARRPTSYPALKPSSRRRAPCSWASSRRSRSAARGESVGTSNGVAVRLGSLLDHDRGFSSGATTLSGSDRSSAIQVVKTSTSRCGSCSRRRSIRAQAVSMSSTRS